MGDAEPVRRVSSKGAAAAIAAATPFPRCRDPFLRFVYIELPLDVRPALHAWETSTFLAATFERPEPRLVPAQLPFQATAPWLALQFPASYSIDGDRLLYTAHYAAPFDPSARQCGLLLDDWTEVVPGTSKDTGITFNFDRPDNEPPQAILLVTPATADGVCCPEQPASSRTPGSCRRRSWP